MKKRRAATAGSRRPRPEGRVLARVLADDLREVNGGYPPIYMPTDAGSDTTASEAATSETIGES